MYFILACEYDADEVLRRRHTTAMQWCVDMVYYMSVVSFACKSALFEGYRQLQSKANSSLRKDLIRSKLSRKQSRCNSSSLLALTLLFCFIFMVGEDPQTHVGAIRICHVTKQLLDYLSTQSYRHEFICPINWLSHSKRWMIVTSAIHVCWMMTSRNTAPHNYCIAGVHQQHVLLYRQL